MLKRIIGRTIGLSLLCMVSHAYSANIIVNTTDDEDVDNTKCSLREAVELINRTDASGKIPEAGYKGCSGKEATANIVLETGKTYNLNTEIKIKKSLQINVLDSAGNATKFGGENNAIIKATGKDRIFTIDDENPNISNLTVTIREVNFIGCGTTACQVDNGGLINNHENLTLSFSRLSQGYANNGGAIYNEGIASSSTNTDASAGSLTLTNVLIDNNKANQGAALYSVQPRFDLINSVVRNNEILGFNGSTPSGLGENSGFIIYTSLSNATSGVRTGNIKNATIFSNKGWVVNLLDAMVINNTTIIKNDAGVYLNAASGSANFSNSIVADNGGTDGSKDCAVGASNKAVTNNLVYRGGDCQAAQTTENVNPNRKLDADEKLIAGNEIAKAADKRENAACDIATADGLLCPFQYKKEVYNGFFKPRLLMRYTKLSDSPIINRGRVFPGGTTSSTQACEATDQRGKTRETSVLCDVGAVELVIEDEGKIGQDIKYDQIASIDLADNLGDGQLIPKELCDRIVSGIPEVLRPIPIDGKDKPWQDGCLNFVVGKEAKKGTFLLNIEGLLKYTPFKNFHGSDNFSINIITTTSRFSEGSNDRSITLNGTIVQEPDREFPSKSVNISGGATGLLGLIGMLGLAGLRRRLQGVK